MPAKRILIVDDNQELVALLASLLQARGYQVTIAHDGIEGLQFISREAPDVVVLDINMPRMGGIEFYKTICTKYGRSRYPVVIITARKELKDLFKSLAVDSFLPKPFEISDLLSEIEKLSDRDRNPWIYLVAQADNLEVEKLRIVLKSERYNVFLTKDLQILKFQTRERVPHFLIVECYHEVLDCTELIQKIREIPFLKSIPLFGYSHSGFLELKKKALQAGATEFIDRPENYDAFFHAIQRFSIQAW